MSAAALATLAGDTLVAAVVTDAWEDMRQRVSRLFGRGEPDPAAERRLDTTREQLIVVTSAEFEEVRAEQAAHWATRFADLLADHPGAGEELEALVGRTRAALPAGAVSAGGHSIAAGGGISIAASGGSTAVGVLHGNLAPPDPRWPGPGSGQPGTGV